MLKKKLLSSIMCLIITSIMITSNVHAASYANDNTGEKLKNSNITTIKDGQAKKNANASTNNIINNPDPVVLFWNGAVIAGYKYGYNCAADLLFNAIGPNRGVYDSYTASNLTYYESDAIGRKILNNSADYNNLINNLRSRYTGSSGTINISLPLIFQQSNNGDLFLALHETTAYVTGLKRTPYGSFSFYIHIHDYYDFDYKKATYASQVNMINNLAYATQELGKLQNFSVDIYLPEKTCSSNISYPGYYIQYGSTGYYVTAVQSQLNSLGYNCGTVDGDFGNNTKNAVISYQRSHGLEADGVVGPATWSKLFS